MFAVPEIQPLLSRMAFKLKKQPFKKVPVMVYDSTHEIDDAIQYRDIRMIFSELENSSVLFDDVFLRHPWIFPIKGESNAGRPNLYACQFPTMINDWRKKFHAASDGETSDHFPFGFVQLTPYRAGNTIGGFPPTGWAQTTDVGYVPNINMPDTFMAVAIDLPDFNSSSGAIHPTYKQDIAARLVLGARNIAYEEHNVIFQGPFPTTYSVDNGLHSLTITFDNGTGSLHMNNNNGFELCCASTTSGCSYPASWIAAPIKVTMTSEVVIDTSSCHGNYHIAGVRYLWKESPCALKQCALYDSHTQLPVLPFIKIEVFKTPASIVVG